MEYGKVYLTGRARHAAVRAALAGEPMVTPKELCIYMGINYDDITEELEDEAARDLRSHGYKREMVAIRFYGPLEERWVRHEHWPEDDQWPE